MITNHFHRIWTLVLATVLVAMFGVNGLHAQQTRTSSERCTVVVLEPDQSEDFLVAELVASMTRCELKGQAWFVEAVESAGVEARQILTRPDELATVLKEADIALVVYLPAVDRDRFVRVLGADGGTLEERRLDIARSKISKDHAPLIRDALVAHLPGPAAGPSADSAAEAPAEPPPSRRSTRKAPERGVEPSPAPSRRAAPASGVSDSVRLSGEGAEEDVRWIHVYAGFSLTERAYMLSDRTQRSASLRTPLFPGYRAGVVAYPFYDSRDPSKAAGFLVEFGQGFDEVVFLQPGQRTEASASKLEIEAAFLYRFQSFDSSEYAQGPTVALRAGAHWSRYAIDESIATPIDTNQLGIDLGVRVEQGLWFDWLGLEWDMVAHPFVGDVSDVALGSQDWGLGVSTDVSLNVRAYSTLFVRLGWSARVIRSWYTGFAANNFEDVDVMLFEQSTNLALNYWW